MADSLLFVLIVVLVIGALIYVIGRPNRYSKMTDEDFEADAKKGSILGSVVIGMERSLRRREADLVIEQKLRIERDATPSGDKPHPENPQPAEKDSRG